MTKPYQALISKDEIIITQVKHLFPDPHLGLFFSEFNMMYIAPLRLLVFLV
jgi:hypothetical protein